MRWLACGASAARLDRRPRRRVERLDVVALDVLDRVVPVLPDGRALVADRAACRDAFDGGGELVAGGVGVEGERYDAASGHRSDSTADKVELLAAELARGTGVPSPGSGRSW